MTVDAKTDVELVVLREIALGTPYGDSLYRFITEVVVTACNLRRNCRVIIAVLRPRAIIIIMQPTHEGTMTQGGYNGGPRHLLVYQLAKSYVKKISDEAAVGHDLDMIAVATIVWNIAVAFLPTEVVDEIQHYWDESNLPRLATRNVPTGVAAQYPFPCIYSCFDRGW